jgi:hypothetical protein
MEAEAEQDPCWEKGDLIAIIWAECRSQMQVIGTIRRRVRPLRPDALLKKTLRSAYLSPS